MEKLKIQARLNAKHKDQKSAIETVIRYKDHGYSEREIVILALNILRQIPDGLNPDAAVTLHSIISQAQMGGKNDILSSK